MSDEIHVLVADDQQLVREGLHVLLGLTPDIHAGSDSRPQEVTALPALSA